MGPAQRTRRLRAWLGNPLATLLITFVLVTDAIVLPFVFPRTTVSRALTPIIRTVPSPAKPPRRELFIVRSGKTCRVIDPETQSWDELSSIIENNEPLVRCIFSSAQHRNGFWSHVSETEYRSLTFQPLIGIWQPQDIEAARYTIFSDATHDSSWREWANTYKDIAEQDHRTQRILWPGIAHDAFALLTFAALCYSFTGWPAWFASRPWSRRSRRLARGLCPACGYDARGLATCPECGTESPLRG